jgi:hypothetical protein
MSFSLSSLTRPTGIVVAVSPTKPSSVAPAVEREDVALIQLVVRRKPWTTCSLTEAQIEYGKP